MSAVPQVGIDGRGRLAVINAFEHREEIKDLHGVRYWPRSKRSPACWTMPATPGAAAALLTVLLDTGARISPGVLKLAQEESTREARRATAADERLPLPKLAWDRWLKTTPWPHQKRGSVFLRDSSAAALGMGMGTGKSLTVVGALNMLEVSRTLVVGPVATLGVFPRELRLHSAWEYHTENGVRRTRIGTLRKLSLVDRWELVTELFDCRCGRPHCAVIGYEAMVADPVASADMGALGVEAVVYDECLPAGTMVDTPAGKKPIESLRIGDQVVGVDHSTGELTVTTVRYTFSSETSKPLCEVDGVPMTANHPVWTARGYVRADDVRSDDVLCRVEGDANGGEGRHLRMVRESAAANGSAEQSTPLLRQGVLGALANVTPRVRGGNARETQHPTAAGAGRTMYARSASASRRCREAPRALTRAVEPFPGPDGAGAFGCHESGEGLAAPQRRQRHCSDGGADVAFATVGLADGGDRSYRAARAAADALQTGCRVSERHGGDRVRWSVTPDSTSTGTGFPQGRIFGLVRLDGTALHQRTDSDRDRLSDSCRQVFNIETGTGNYVAEGLLVHNCHRLKAAGGTMSLTAYSWVNQIGRRWGLSGTLMPQTPDDIYGTYRALDPAIFGTNKADFRTEYIQMGTTKDGTREYPKDVKRRKRLEFSGKFHSIAYVPVVDLKLPRATHAVRSFELEPAARKIYNDIRDTGIAEITAAVVAAGGSATPAEDERTVSPANAGVEYLRFAQITGGFVKDDSNVISVVSKAKVTELAAVLDEVACRPGGYDGKSRPEPVVVFCRFHPDLDAIEALCKKLGLRYAEVSGRRKDGIDDNAHMNPDADVVAAQIASGSQGIDFTRSRVNVWYSVGFELWLFQQAQKRSDRPGQTRSVANYYLTAEETIDGIIYTALARKEGIIDACTNAYLHHVAAADAERPTIELPAMPNEGDGEIAGTPPNLPDWMMGTESDAPRALPDLEREAEQKMLALGGLEGF